MSVDVTADLPETVVTIGGNSRKYHQQHPMHDDPQPLCQAAVETLYEKDRETIESHYEPCGHCFPRAARKGE